MEIEQGKYWLYLAKNDGEMATANCPDGELSSTAKLRANWRWQNDLLPNFS
jgi:hypothetical protein